MAGLALILDGIATLTTREECCEEAVKERKVELGGYFRRRRRMSLEEKVPSPSVANFSVTSRVNPPPTTP